jgi:hypothetical protein
VPFFSEAPDPDSDVVVTLSLRTYRLVCLRCGLGKGDRTETETCDAMMQHLDDHRAAGHRVPDSFYDGSRDAWKPRSVNEVAAGRPGSFRFAFGHANACLS